MGESGAKALEHTVAPEPSPGVKAQSGALHASLGEFHSPELVIRPGQGRLISAAQGPSCPYSTPKSLTLESTGSTFSNPTFT